MRLIFKCVCPGGSLRTENRNRIVERAKKCLENQVVNHEIMPTPLCNLVLGLGSQAVISIPRRVPLMHYFKVMPCALFIFNCVLCCAIFPTAEQIYAFLYWSLSFLLSSVLSPTLPCRNRLIFVLLVCTMQGSRFNVITSVTSLLRFHPCP